MLLKGTVSKIKIYKQRKCKISKIAQNLSNRFCKNFGSGHDLLLKRLPFSSKVYERVSLYVKNSTSI